MKVGELKKILENVNDDFEIRINYYEHAFSHIKCNLEFQDIGYSDKIIAFEAIEDK